MGRLGSVLASALSMEMADWTWRLRGLLRVTPRFLSAAALVGRGSFPARGHRKNRFSLKVIVWL